MTIDMNPRVEYQKQTGKSPYRYETEDGKQSGETHEYVAWLEKQYAKTHEYVAWLEKQYAILTSKSDTVPSRGTFMGMVKRLLEEYCEASHPGDYDAQGELMENICDGTITVPLEQMSAVVNEYKKRDTNGVLSASPEKGTGET